MLILTRKIQESILIGNDICITVLEIKGNQVRIGISAPPEVTVYREELHTRLQSEPVENSRFTVSKAPLIQGAAQ